MQPREPDDPERVGAYQVLGRLGKGGMGVVYLARSPGGRTVAVKVIQPRFVTGAEHRARFRREITAARQVTGAFTAPVLDADPDATPPWLVTAYLPGMSLWDAVGAFGGMPATAVRALAAGLAEALAAIHGAGVVHRDLKPGNVMLTAGGPKVIDFGIARPEDATAITQVGMTVGTTRYASPEQRAGSLIGPESDIYSLGTVLVFAVTGTASDAGWDPSGITDRWLREVAEDCLRWKPAHRPSAAELLDRLGYPRVSLQGTGWLPPPLAEAVDRRTAQARQLPPAVDAPSVDPAVMGGATEGSTVTTAGRRSRRAVLGAGLVGVGILATGGGRLLWSSRGSDPATASSWTSGSPAPGSPAPSSPRTEPPPLATRRWEVRISDYYPDLTVAGGTVQAWSDDQVHALDPRTGRVRWQRTINADGTAASVGRFGTVAGDAAYVVDHSQQQLSAIRAGSGETRWTYQTPFGELPGPRLAATGSAVFTGGEKPVRALGVADGRPRWTADVNAENGIAAGDGLVVAAAPNRLVGLDASNGETRWTYELDEAGAPAIGEGLVYAYDRHGTLHAVRTGNGEGAWRRPDAGYGSDLPLADGIVYVSSYDGNVHALRAATGEPVWSRRFGQGEGAPYGRINRLGLSGHTLYVAATDQTVYALGPANNRLLWRYIVDVTLGSPPVSFAGLVFVGARDGSVHAVGPPDGGPRATA